MPLFHPRVIGKYIKIASPAPVAIQKILQTWSENLEKGLYDSETKNDGQFIEHILVQVLGYKQSGTSPTAWTLVKNQPIAGGNVDAALGHFGVSKELVIAPFELKGAKTQDLDAVMPGRGKTPVQQVWEYAMDAKGAKWALLSNFREIRLYAVGYGRKDYERFDLFKPFDAGNYEKLMLLLSADNLLGGETARLLTESESVEKSVTDALYADYRELRLKLISTISTDNPSIPSLDVLRYSQTILDRLLFIAFAEDRGLLPKSTLKSTFEASNPYAPQPIWENFKGLFTAINVGNPPLKIPGYNGGLFAEDTNLNSLQISNALCESFQAIGAYDFDSEVSVNILGHIFEQSISDIEEIKSASAGPSAPAIQKQKKDGIFYTPPHITRYIVEHAVGGWLSDRKDAIGFSSLPLLEESDYKSIKITKGGKSSGKITYNKNIEAHIKAWEAYDSVLREITVLDPACGSGAFLNEVFDYLFREGQAVNSQLSILRGGQEHLFRWDTHILSKNIFGIDINSESVEITKLSLWLKTANKAEKLTYLDDNIKCGNSLISDPAVAGTQAFDWSKQFPLILKKGGFDVVLGNPPYVLSRDNNLDNLKEYAKKNYTLYTDKPNLYLLFIEKGLSLVVKGGYLSFIVPNSFLGVESAAKCRRHLVECTQLQTIVNLLGPTFKKASVEAMAFCARKIDPGTNTVAVGTIRRPAELELPLTNVDSSEWLKSPTVIFDLKSDVADRKLLAKLGSLSKLEEFYDVKAGLQAYERGKGTPAQTAADVKAHPFDYDHKFDNVTYRYLNGGDVGRYLLTWSGKWLRWGPWLSQPRDMILFTGEGVLVREITGVYPRSLLCSYVEDVYLNNKSIINVIPKSEKSDMKYVAGVLNSRLISFFHSRLSVKSNRLLFPKAVIADIKSYPLVIADQKDREEISSRVESLQKLYSDQSHLMRDFANLMHADLGLKSVKGAILSWHEATFAEILKEIESQKVSVSLEKKGAWIKHHQDMKKKWQEISIEIERIEIEIDTKVNEIYQLTADEILLLNS